MERKTQAKSDPFRAIICAQEVAALFQPLQKVESRTCTAAGLHRIALRTFTKTSCIIRASPRQSALILRDRQGRFLREVN
jgi:hypothetical protein